MALLAAALPAIAATPKLDLRIEPQGWGSAALRDVEAVLRSAAAQLLVHFPDVELPPIQVSPRGGPIVLYQRGDDGAVIMRLNTGDTYWSQYAFQFAHELCHVLCRFGPRPAENKWFEESICELASLYVLRAMAKEWEVRPPYPNWKAYGRNLAEYARKRMEAGALPEGMDLAAWYRQNADALRQDPTDRARNTIVATALLPLFEREPRHWAAVWHLNDAPPQSGRSFEDHLAWWHAHAPAEHRPFIAAIAARFGIALEER